MKYPDTYSAQRGHYYRKSHAEWKGTSAGDAFKHNLRYHQRIPAQRLFYANVNKVQKSIAIQTGAAAETEFAPKIKPQLGPCYTYYPSMISAYAAIGLTAFLEYKARVSENILSADLSDFIEYPWRYIQWEDTDEAVFKQIAQRVIEYVETRLLLEDMSRLKYASSVEMYRLFMASQETMRFQTVPEIIRGLVLYGDILPSWKNVALHPMTELILEKLASASEPFLKNIGQTHSHELVDFGASWVKAICLSLLEFLPQKEIAGNLDEAAAGAGTPENALAGRFKKSSPRQLFNDSIPPLNGKRPPLLFDTQNIARQTASMLGSQLDRASKISGKTSQGNTGSGGENQSMAGEILKKFASTIDNITRQSGSWEDMRSDHVESALRTTGFRQSPVEGNPADGHSVSMDFGDENIGSGEVFDRPIELSDDMMLFDKLKGEAQPVTDVLKRSLYPNIVEYPENDRFKTSGGLDPLRLPMSDICSAIYRRHNIYERADQRGKPMLVIACDGSGSLNRDQMRMLKILTAAWISAIKKSSIQFIAGLYHSGNIRKGISGALVQWLYHPHKTPSLNPADAIRGLVAMPDSGTGCQSDALSLNFILDEAKRIARGRMVYLVILSDCCWNQSFYVGKSGQEEVQYLMEQAYENFNGKLNATLVALGVSGETGFENRLDKVITVSSEDLADSAAVAGKIAGYVASCMKERKKWISKN